MGSGTLCPISDCVLFDLSEASEILSERLDEGSERHSEVSERQSEAIESLSEVSNRVWGMKILDTG